MYIYICIGIYIYIYYIFLCGLTPAYMNPSPIKSAGVRTIKDITNPSSH